MADLKNADIAQIKANSDLLRPQDSVKINAHQLSQICAMALGEWASAPFEADQRDIRDKALADAADRLYEEYLTDTTGSPSDDAYNMAVSHCIRAVIDLIQPDRIDAAMSSQSDTEESK